MPRPTVLGRLGDLYERAQRAILERKAADKGKLLSTGSAAEATKPDRYKLLSTGSAKAKSGEWGPGGGLPEEAYGENRYLATQEQYDQPGASEQYWNQLMGKYNVGSTPQSTNNAYEAYVRFRDSQPVNMDPYYDNARKEATQGIDQAMAARGMYGSSAATNRIGDTLGDIGAQQSRDEAAYQLQRGGLQGELARGADLSSLAQVQNELGWLTGLGGRADAAEAARLARLTTGQDAAFRAQDAAEAEKQNEFNRNMMQQQIMADYVYKTLNGAIGDDMTLAGMIPEYEMGGAAAADQESKDRSNKFWAEMDNASKLVGRGMSIGASGAMDGGLQKPYG